MHQTKLASFLTNFWRTLCILVWLIDYCCWHTWRLFHLWSFHLFYICGCVQLKSQSMSNINCLDMFANTALHLAAMNGRKQVVIILLQSGIDATLRNARSMHMHRVFLCVFKKMWPLNVNLLGTVRLLASSLYIGHFVLY